MKITKMHGLGNDFILTEEYAEDYAAAAIRLCQRRLSVGADGLVAVAYSQVADAKMRIFNADGSEAEMCGNAIRCFARYLYDHGIVRREEMAIETLAGIMKPRLIIERGAVTGVCVDMGLPDFAPERIPANVDDSLEFKIDACGRSFDAAAVLMGVPHVVIFGDFSEEEVCDIGEQIECHELFPRDINVNFATIVVGGIKLRTFERGVGRTLACGTGSCATAVIANKKGLIGNSVDILLEAGRMHIDIEDDGRVLMTGPAEYVFTGETAFD